MKIKVFSKTGTHIGWMRIKDNTDPVNSSVVTDSGQEASDYTQEELEEFKRQESHIFEGE